MTKTIIPNTTPWTLLVEVVAFADTDNASVYDYPLIAWKLEDAKAYPVAHGEHSDGGATYRYGKVESYAVLALHNPTTGRYRVLWGIGVCGIEALIADARNGLRFVRGDAA